jgi:flagellar L-ring protein precursor FlgH
MAPCTTIALSVLMGCSMLPPERGDPGYTPAMPTLPPSRGQSAGSIYQAGYETRWFEDLTARRVGDILTVVLVEKTDAKKSAVTGTDRDTRIEMPNPTLFGRTPSIGGRDVFENNVESSTIFDGEGDSAQSNKLDGTITVSVAQVLPNGYLVVQGEKWIGINQGDEFMRLRGIVRPVDIRADNTVLSTQVGNAQIAYGGTGVLADTNRQGWLTRFFSTIVWPL